jgi:predicted Ser/Thr protein kinase
MILEVIGDTYLTSLQAIGTCLKSTYSALEDASVLWYDASKREAARVSALEEEANLVLDNFSELEDALVDQEFDSLLQRLDDGVSLEDLLKSEEEDVDNVRPPRDAVQSVLDEAWRMDRMVWLSEEQQWLDEVGSLGVKMNRL